MAEPKKHGGSSSTPGTNAPGHPIDGPWLCPGHVRAGDKDFVLHSLRHKAGALVQFASEELMDDEDVLFAASQGGFLWVLEIASPRLQNDKAFVMRFISESSLVASGKNLEYASETLQDDEEVVQACMKQYQRYGMHRRFDEYRVYYGNYVSILQYASERVRNNADFACGAVCEFGNPKDVKVLSPRLLDTAGIMLYMDSRRPAWKVFRYASERLRNDPTTVKLALKQNPRNRRFIGTALYDDKEFLLQANSLAPKLLQRCIPFASRRLRRDPDIFRLLIAHEGGLAVATRHMNREHRPFALDLVQRGASLGDMHRSFRNDKPFVLAAVGADAFNLQCVSGRLQKDRDVALAAARTEGTAFFRYGKYWHWDAHVVAAALESTTVASAKYYWEHNCVLWRERIEHLTRSLASRGQPWLKDLLDPDLNQRAKLEINLGSNKVIDAQDWLQRVEEKLDLVLRLADLPMDLRHRVALWTGFLQNVDDDYVELRACQPVMIAMIKKGLKVVTTTPDG